MGYPPLVMATRAAAPAVATAFLLLAVGVDRAGATDHRLLLFGGPERRDFLGCVTCEGTDPYSIWNPDNDYGSPKHPLSIWNRTGRYGSENSPDSPWTARPETPPVVVDRVGNFCGYFVIDRSFPERVKDDYLVWLLEGHDWIADHLDEVRGDFRTQGALTLCGLRPPGNP